MKKFLAYILLFVTFVLPTTVFAAPSDIASQTMSSYDLFTPPLTDKSVSYLGQVFGTVGGVVHGTSGQLLAEIFRVFNYAMVILASCVVVYTVVLSVINTANEGEFMGKQINSGWAIIRAILGIGILVPKYTGYSMIQVFVMWATIQGVGLADKAWGRAIDYLGNEGGVVYAAPAETLGKDNGMSKTFGVVSQMFNSEICMYKLQDIARKERADALAQLKNDPTNPTLLSLLKQPYPQYRPVFNENAMTVSFGFPSTRDDTQSVCGQYTWRKGNPGDDPNVAAQGPGFDQYMKVGLNQIVNNLAPAAKSLAEYSDQTLTDGQKRNLRDRSLRALLGATADYENMMRPALQRASRNGNESWKQTLNEAKEKGWIVAGSYYWDLAKINNKLSDELKNYQPVTNWTVSKDKMEKNGVNAQLVMNTIDKANKDIGIIDVTQLLQALEDKVGKALAPQYKAVLLSMLNNLSSEDPVKRDQALQQLADSIANNSGVTEKPAKVLSNTTMAATGIQTGLLGIRLATSTPAVGIVLAAGLNALVGVWFGVMNSPGDPIGMVQQLGQGMVGIAVSIWLIGSAALAAMTTIMSVMTSVTGVGYGLQNSLKLFVPIVVAFIGVLFVNGMVLSVYVPMIPFMIFTFAAIGWLISVLEAIVAAPLVAASLTRPEGHDLLGKAEQAIMLLLGVFLRPVVMIIGFLAAIILSRVALRIVNAGFNHAFESAGITFSGANLFGVAGVMIVYTMIVISIINLVFNAGVVKLWETIWLWIGFNQHGSTSAEQAMQEIKGGVHSGAQAASDTGGGWLRAESDRRAAQLERGKNAGGIAPNSNGDWEKIPEKGGTQAAPENPRG